jgi:thiol-disulfide isomerase/thioredoxin
LFNTAAILLLVTLSATAVAADSGTAKVTFGEFIAAATPQPAPDVQFADTEGTRRRFADFRGKPVIVNLWATWCQPCLREMPSLERLHEKLDGRLIVAAISQDRGGEQAVVPFAKNLGLDKVKIYLDPKSEVGRAFGARGLPTSIILDAEGREVGRVEGAAEWDSAKMLSVLEPLVKSEGSPAKSAAGGSR